jgi:hypothetical protein
MQPTTSAPPKTGAHLLLISLTLLTLHLLHFTATYLPGCQHTAWSNKKDFYRKQAYIFSSRLLIQAPKPPSPQPTQCRHPSKTHSQAWPTLMILLLTFHALNLPDLATVDCRRIACHCLSVLAANRMGAEREGRHGYCGWVLAYDGVVIAKDDE